MNTEQPFDDKKARFEKERFVQIIADGGTWASASALLGISSFTFSKWLREDDDLAKQYAHAREAQGDIYADRVVDTAMDATIDPAVARVRIDALKWAAGKRKPKVYGDKVLTEHGGPGGGDIIIRAIIGGASANNNG
jgi:hypothetical protein